MGQPWKWVRLPCSPGLGLTTLHSSSTAGKPGWLLERAGENMFHLHRENMFHLHRLPGSLDRSTGVTPFPRTSGRVILLMLGVPWLIQRHSEPGRVPRDGEIEGTGSSHLQAWEGTVLAISSSHPAAPLALPH